MLDVFKSKRLHELGLDDVRALLDDTHAEPLHWEAKGVELKPGEVRNQICEFANSHDGGYLILGTHVSGGKWEIDGLPFPDDDPPAWVSNVARGVQPYPENLDTHAIPVTEDRMVAVVWIPSTPTLRAMRTGRSTSACPARPRASASPCGWHNSSIAATMPTDGCEFGVSGRAARHLRVRVEKSRRVGGSRPVRRWARRLRVRARQRVAPIHALVLERA